LDHFRHQKSYRHFCDLEKAFDSVNNDLLLYKLPYHGISVKAKLLLESYLQNRHQRVKVKLTLEPATKAQRGSRAIALLFP